MAKRFQKKIEDFYCENCGRKVHGTGYTNHCPYCLVSKHVDNFPGDRENECGGLMQIERIEIEHGKHVLNYYCEKCGIKKRNKLQDEDDFNKLIKIQNKLNEQIVKK